VSDAQEPQLIIIGAGPAGLGAALYAGRTRINTLVVEKLSPGGQVLVTDWVDNYLGFPEGVAGYDLIDRMTAHARRFGMQERSAEVYAIEPGVDGRPVSVHLLRGGTLTARAVIVATGARPNRLGVRGEDALTGKGVSYCATCDGAFFRDQVIAVVGGGDSAVQEALFLTRFASKIYLIHRRDQLRATGVITERLLAHPKIEPVWDTVVESIEGEKAVESVAVRDLKTGTVSSLQVGGVFVYCGIRPNTGFVKDVVEMDQWGFILTDEWMKTSAEGIYAAGDCRAKPLRQIISAAAEGATAAYAVQHLFSRTD